MSTCAFAGSFSFLFCFYLLSHLSLFVVFFVIATAYYASKRYDIMTEYHQDVQSMLIHNHDNRNERMMKQDNISVIV